RACAVDQTGRVSGWTAYGGVPSFRIDASSPNAVTTLGSLTPTLATPSLTWTTISDVGPSGVAFYRVYRGSSSTGPWVQVSTDGSPTGGAFNDGGATVNATHWYRVRAVDVAGNEAAASNTVSVYYHRAPNAPSLVA